MPPVAHHQAHKVVTPGAARVPWMICQRNVPRRSTRYGRVGTAWPSALQQAPTAGPRGPGAQGHLPSFPNPMRAFGFTGGVIRSRIASKTTLNWASYFFSSAASLRASPAFC